MKKYSTKKNYTLFTRSYYTKFYLDLEIRPTYKF